MTQPAAQRLNRNGSTPLNTLKAQLDAYYEEIKAVILAKQHPVSGLLPASTAINAHGNYTDAWVRDNVYSILAVWGLALAYRKIDDNQGRAYELEHSTIKLMRGLMVAMMRQAHKVERFKANQDPLEALHAKYDTATADPVVGDDQWGHLQLDATSLYLLTLAQMTASGLQIVFTIDEVNFVQNLVYYIGRAYRTPDYGIWERGNKVNHGDPELNASSVGMAKAALEAMNGLNLFGVRGGQSSVVHVLPDEIARTRITLESLLPRESNSKEVDAALLSVIGYPAFAVDSQALVDRTYKNVVSKLEGNYGCKRFLRDGHQTAIEDSNRLHYEPIELKQFEHIECEWPLFFTYLLLDALFKGDRDRVEHYRDRLEPLLVEKLGWRLLPELYYVPTEGIEAERQNPRSQTRLPNDNVPLVWAQSLYYLGQLLLEGLLDLGDIDPLGRHLKLGGLRYPPIVQITLLAEDEALQAELSTYGIPTQVPQQVEPIQVRKAYELSAIYSQIGRNEGLKLTGRPPRRLRSLTTSRIFRVQDETIVFLPSFLDAQQFYLTIDYHFLVAQIQSEIAYVHHHWYQLGRPTMTLLLSRAMFDAGSSGTMEQSPLLALVKMLKDGDCNGIPVKLGDLYQLLLTAGVERIDDVNDFCFIQAPVQAKPATTCYLTVDSSATQPLSANQEFLLESETDLQRSLMRLRQSSNLYEQTELLDVLAQAAGLEFDTGFGSPHQVVTVADLLREVYDQAGERQLWTIIRRAAGLLNKIDVSLTDAITEILVRQKQITVGKAFSQASLIDRPMPHTEIMAKIREFCGEDVRDRALTQEILVYLSLLIKAEPELFKGFLTLRVSYLILLLTSELALELGATQDEAYEALMRLSPFEVKMRLRQVLKGFDSLNRTLLKQESLHVKQQREIQWVVHSESDLQKPPTGSWWRQRQLDGALNRVPKNFYPRVWQVLEHCKGLVIGDKLERRNRLESDLILAEMTAGEKNFALRIEYLLNKIQAPEYRQVNIEALIELAALSDRNPDLYIEEYIVLDVLIGHAVRLSWLAQHPEFTHRYDEFKSRAWRSFYETSPYDCASYVAEALKFLTELGQTADV